MWKLVLAVVAVAVAAVEGGQLYASAPQDRGQYHNHRTNTGSYNYGYNTGDGVAKVEVKRADGSVVGSYRYFDPNGKQIVRSYIADSKGFRILGNDLPISLETPAAAILGAPALTAPVEGASNAVVDASLDPSKRHNTVDIAAITSSAPVIQQYRQTHVLSPQSDLLEQQQLAIDQMEEQLADLKRQQSLGRVINSVEPADTVQFNTIQDEKFQGETPFYYYPYQYNYDFPAGFAYNTALVEVVNPPSVIGVRGIEAERLALAAGRTRSRFPPRRLPITVVRNTDQQEYQRPYVIGRMR